MKKEKIKVYTYTRVSTAMQIDGYSLDAQKSRMKAFAEFNDYEIAHEYEDAGKSGKSIEGRTQFNQMMEDIKTGKDGVSFVLVFKLSRFGRNAADVLSTLQVMQDFGVNLICVEDGIDSSKDAGKLMISVLSAVAEIERENIRVQTMEVVSKRPERASGTAALPPTAITWWMASWKSTRRKLRRFAPSMSSMLQPIPAQMGSQNILKIMGSAKSSARTGKILFLMLV